MKTRIRIGSQETKNAYIHACPHSQNRLLWIFYTQNMNNWVPNTR